MELLPKCVITHYLFHNVLILNVGQVFLRAVEATADAGEFVKAHALSQKRFCGVLGFGSANY